MPPVDVLIPPIWERQPGESPEAYTALLNSFTASDRISLRSPDSHLPVQVNHSRNQITQWANKWRWTERRVAHDEWLKRRAQEVWIERDWQRREEDFNAGQQLRDVARNSLQTYLDDPTRELPINQVPFFLKIASDLQGAAIPDGSLSQDEIRDIISTMPDEKRKLLIQLMVARMEVS